MNPIVRISGPSIEVQRPAQMVISFANQQAGVVSAKVGKKSFFLAGLFFNRTPHT